MGTTLTGTTPQDTYDSLIKVTDNGPISGTLKALSDGLGNDSVLAISTASSSITAASGAIGLTLANSTGGTKADFTITENVGLAIDFNEGATARSLDLLSAGTSRLFIASTGNVGIGTSAPTDKLHVSNGNIKSSNSGNTISTTISNDGVYAAGTDLYLLAPATKFVAIYANNAERVRVTDNGLTFNGDTAAANALDDYEEGTFNYVITFGGSDTGVTYANRLGAYTKIGRKVTCTGWIRLTSKGTATGSAAIGGLPFSIASGAENYAAPTIGYVGGISFADQISGYAILSAARFELVETTNAGVLSSITDSDFSNGAEIMISFTYFV